MMSATGSLQRSTACRSCRSSHRVTAAISKLTRRRSWTKACSLIRATSTGSTLMLLSMRLPNSSRQAAAVAGRSIIVCVTGGYRGSVTGAHRFRLFIVTTVMQCPCRSINCLSYYRKRSSSPVMDRPSKTCRNSSTWLVRSAVKTLNAKPTHSTRLSSRLGTTRVTPARTTNRRCSMNAQPIGCRSINIRAASSMRFCISCMRASSTKYCVTRA